MRRITGQLLIGILLLGVARPLGAGQAKAPEPAYRVVKSFPVGGDGGWDYATVDSASRRVFLSRATRVIVVNVDSGATAGEIPNTDGVHGIAIAGDLKKGFTSNGRASTVTIFDLKTLAVLANVKTTGENPDAILYDPSTHRVFTFNGRGGNATAIDAAAGTVVGTIALGGRPEFAVSDLAGRLYVNLEDKNEVLALDPKKLEVVARWPLAPCEEPSGLAIDVRSRRLFVGCANKLMAVVRTNDGHVVTTLPIGEGTDAIAFDPDRGLAFSSNRDGTLTVVKEESPDSFKVVQNLETRQGSKTMALDPKTHTVYLPAARFGPAPAPTADRPHPRPAILPGTFEVLVVSAQNP